MNFTSIEFLLFFPVILLLYWLLPGRMRWILLLFASCLFYMSQNPWMVFLLLGNIVVSYGAALRIACEEKASARRMWLAAGVVIPLLCLGIFKYTGFFVSGGVRLLQYFGWNGEAFAVNIVLPVGISFYTFQTLSYVLDVYRGRVLPERHFGYYALFVSFFPQLVAGPIERPERLLPQLRAEHRPDQEDFRQGVWQILRGFFKKLTVADVLAKVVDPVFATPKLASGPAVILATVCFALQIYCDFSGYSDIACGTARLMGIRLIQNFDHPYRAGNIRDFWRRWHISLTDWFSDYVYKPLGGSRAGIAANVRNILLVFLLSGLWHGANWNFVVWGGIHGLYQAAGILYRRFHPSGSDGGVVLRGIRQLRTFALVCFAWIFFRSDSLGDALLLIKSLFMRWDLKGLASVGALAEWHFLTAAQVFSALLSFWLLEQMPEELSFVSSAREMVRRCFMLFLFVLTISFSWFALFSATGENAFLYFQF